MGGGLKTSRRTIRSHKQMRADARISKHTKHIVHSVLMMDTQHHGPHDIFHAGLLRRWTSWTTLVVSTSMHLVTAAWLRCYVVCYTRTTSRANRAKMCGSEVETWATKRSRTMWTQVIAWIHRWNDRTMRVLREICIPWARERRQQGQQRC